LTASTSRRQVSPCSWKSPNGGLKLKTWLALRHADLLLLNQGS
jgi:hypothetical protein